VRDGLFLRWVQKILNTSSLTITLTKKTAFHIIVSNKTINLQEVLGMKQIRLTICLLVTFFFLISNTVAAENQTDSAFVRDASALLKFSESLAGISLQGQWGFIDIAGKLVISAIYHEVRSFQEGFAPARIDKRWGFINKKGKFVINPTFDDARSFSEGLAPVKKGNLWGCIDEKGKIVLDYSFEDLKRFSGGLAPAKRTGKWGFINPKGKFILSRTWLDAGEFADDLAPVKTVENQWGYVNSKGKLVIEAQFDNARIFSQGLAPVLEETKWGYINNKGKFEINPQYEDAHPYSKNVAAVKSEGLWGYLNKKGTFAIAPSYVSASDFSKDGIALVEKDGESFYIGTDGKKLFGTSIRKTKAEQMTSSPITKTEGQKINAGRTPETQQTVSGLTISNPAQDPGATRWQPLIIKDPLAAVPLQNRNKGQHVIIKE
jgi:hypothetical protein